jgi:hypothetical protein
MCLLKYGIMHFDICIIHMKIVSTNLINIVPFQNVQISALPSCPYDVHLSVIVP